LKASQSQRHGIDSVNEAIKDIDAMTQQNAALVEQAAAAATSMRQQSGQLSEVVGTFKVS
jgi:methyl-accepting chemotaxis protein